MANLSDINTRLVDSMLAHQGLRREGGVYGNVGPLLPYALIDAQYMLYKKYIQKANVGWVKYDKLRATIQMNRDHWKDSYDEFNKSINRSWDTDQINDVQTMMDSLEDFIANDLLIMQVSAMNLIDHLDLQHQEVIAASVVCNIIAQYAQIAWKAVYKSLSGKSKKNNQIQGIIDNTYKFENSYYKAAGDSKDVNLEADKKFSMSVEILAKKIVQWLRDYR